MRLEEYDETTREFIKALTPALQSYVCRINGLTWAHGPLLITTLGGSEPEELNRIFLAKSSRAAEYLANVRFDPSAYIYLHERPYRLAAFREIQNRISDAQYWRYLGDVWQDTEYVYSDLKVWRSLFHSQRRHRLLLSHRAERHYLRSLPESFTVYRGYQECKPSHKMGMSWTLSKEQAIWFAFRRKENGKPRAIEGRCNKSDVFGYLNERKEEEIIIDPKCVQNVRQVRLPKEYTNERKFALKVTTYP